MLTSCAHRINHRGDATHIRAPLLMLAALAFLTVSTGPVAAQTVAVRDLGTLFSGGYSRADGINNRGEVVGVALSESGFEVPILWTTDGRMERILGNRPGLAWAINDHGQVVGLYRETFADEFTRGFLWSRDDGLIDLGTSFLPYDINHRGQMSGQCLDTRQACVLSDGVLTHLGSLGSFSNGWGINESGDVAGSTDTSDGTTRPFLWTRATGMIAFPSDDHSSAYDVNDRGEAVGSTCCGLRAAVWLDRVPRHPFGNSTTDGYALNNLGWGAGIDWDAQRGFLWFPNGGIIALQPLHGGDLTQAFGINDAGQVVGLSKSQNGAAHAVIWTVTPDVPRIETPNTTSNWGIGTTQRIAWFYPGTQASSPRFTIEVSRDGGEWEFLDVVNNKPGYSQSYYWTVTGPMTPAARIRVSVEADPLASDINDADIRIAEPFIDILRPTGRRPAKVGSAVRVFWTHNLGARRPVALDVSVDGGAWREVIPLLQTTGSHTASVRWIVSGPPTTRARLRIRALDISGTSGVSPSFAVE